MNIHFQSISLQNFKSHQQLTVEFGDITRISGDNAQGKTTIIEAIPWILFGTDMLGSKADPSPTNYTFDEVRAQLLLVIDDKPVMLGRFIKGGKAGYLINEDSSTATEFDELVKSLFDKDVFLSLYNPSYFFSIHWEKQRELFLRYVLAPANKEVFAQMDKLQADKLAELVKTKSIAKLENNHKENKNDKDREHIAAQSRVKTLDEQLRSLPLGVSEDIESIRANVAKITDAILELEKATETAGADTASSNRLQARIESLRGQIKASFERWPQVRDEPIDENCPTCQRKLDDEASNAVKEAKEHRKADYKTNHDGLKTQLKSLEADLAAITPVDVSEQYAKIRELEQERQALVNAIHEKERRDKLLHDIESAKQAEADTLASRNASIFIIDAIKAFEAKEAELMAAKAQGMFTTLSLRLFETQKNGVIKNMFEIEMDGKPYRKLSLSESIKAGLELREVMSQQSGILAPCVIDNGESITRFKQPSGQLIVSRVVADQPLKIESEAAK